MNLDVIRTLTIRSRTEAVGEATAALKRLNDEYKARKAQEKTSRAKKPA